jgi:Ferric reductase like transmembrane component
VSLERMPGSGPARTRVGLSRPTPRDLLIGAGHGLAAVAGTGLFFLLLGDPGRQGAEGYGVQLLRATGVTALVWSYAGLIIGLVVGIRPPPPLRPYRLRLITIHRQLNLAALALIVAHVVSYAGFTPGGSWLVALVPQTASVSRLGYTAGVLALYLAVVLGPSYYLRQWIGHRVWLVAHQLAAVTYALALWHTLVLGADARFDGVWRTLLWVMQVPLLLLFWLRLSRPLRAADQLDALRRPARYASGRHAVLRGAVITGVCLAGFGVLYVALSALGPGLHGPG